MVFIWLAVIFRNDKLIQPIKPFSLRKQSRLSTGIARRGFLCTFTNESEGCVLIIMDEAVLNGVQKLQTLWRQKKKKKEEDKKKESIVTNTYLNIYKDF